jgi:hypothetical protein
VLFDINEEGSEVFVRLLITSFISFQVVLWSFFAVSNLFS